jgi:hypothetical protein
MSETTTQETADWTCTQCRREGTVTYQRHAGVWEVFTALLDDHRRAAPNCNGGRDTIRVVRLGPDS